MPSLNAWAREEAFKIRSIASLFLGAEGMYLLQSFSKVLWREEPSGQVSAFGGTLYSSACGFHAYRLITVQFIPPTAGMAWRIYILSLVLDCLCHFWLVKHQVAIGFAHEPFIIHELQSSTATKDLEHDVPMKKMYIPQPADNFLWN